MSFVTFHIEKYLASLSKCLFQGEMRTSVPSGYKVRVSLVASCGLLGPRPHVLRRLALDRLSLHARCMAYIDFHSKLYGLGVVCLFPRDRGKA